MTNSQDIRHIIEGGKLNAAKLVIYLASERQAREALEERINAIQEKVDHPLVQLRGNKFSKLNNH